MLTVLLLASVFTALEVAPSFFSDQVIEAKSAYRDCIADTFVNRPRDEAAETTLAVALENCRDIELALRAASKAVPYANPGDTLALVLDTRIEGEEAGLRQREFR